MNIEIDRFSGLKQFAIEDSYTTMVSGFMDKEGCRELAAKLISAAEDLLYGDMSLEEFLAEK